MLRGNSKGTQVCEQAFPEPEESQLCLRKLLNNRVGFKLKYNSCLVSPGLAA